MSYQVIARKWRPKVFEDLIGQDHVARTLSNSINSKRIAHGYLFAGPRGVGKTSTARIFAKALNCPNATNGIPCNTCSTCTEITNGNGIDVIEIDGASNNSVDNIRDLRENIRFTPVGGRYKIYIIDEVHMLSKGAFNALLKTLEEPPKHAVFIFATTEIHKVLPTILSRCQRFDFKRIPITAIVETLQKICLAESIQVDQAGLIQVAKKADGSMRDAQSVLDQLISFCGTKITSADVQSVLGIISQDLFFEITQAFIEKNTGNAFSIIEQLFQDGFDLTEVIHGLEEHLRHLLVCISTNGTELIDTADDYKKRFMSQSVAFTQMDILRIIEILQKTEQLIRSGNHPRIKLELAFAKICQMDKTVEISALLGTQSIEKKKSENDLIQSTNAIMPPPDNAQKNDDPIIDVQKESNTNINLNDTLQLDSNSNDKNIIKPSIIEKPVKLQIEQIKKIDEAVHSELNTTDKIITTQPITDDQESKTEVIEKRDFSNDFETKKDNNELITNLNQTIEAEKTVVFEPLNEIDQNLQFNETQPNVQNEPQPETADIPMQQGNIITVESQSNEQVDFIRTHWKNLINDLKEKKPTLAACLSQSFLKELNGQIVTIIFDDTDAGKFNLNTFIMNNDFLKTSLIEKTKLQLKFKTALENFDKTGVEIETKDLTTVVERLRQKDGLINSAMETFALEAIEFGRKL